MKILILKKKCVFSKTQKRTDDKAIFINENIPEEVNKLKNKSGKDIWLYGGASLITNFINFIITTQLAEEMLWGLVHSNYSIIY